MLLQYLPLSNINLADDSYRITFAPRLDALKGSIKAVGLVSPINVRHTPEGTFQIVTGYKRVLVLQELGRQSIPALVHEPNDLSPTQAFLWNLHDNAIARPLNLVEKAMAMAKLSQFSAMSEEDLVKQFLPLLDEEPSYKILHNLLSLANLTEPMKHHVVMSDLALSSAARIAEFTASTQQALLPVLAHIRPSTNKLNELLALLREISARDACSVEEILSRYQLLQVVADASTAPADKVRALRQALRGLRLPQLTERQRQLAELINGLDLPDSARLVADPYFENQTMKLEYQFSQPEELTHLIAKIQDAFVKQQWQQIFEWYRAKSAFGGSSHVSRARLTNGSQMAATASASNLKRLTRQKKDVLTFEIDQAWVDRAVADHPQTIRILNRLGDVPADVVDDVHRLKRPRDIGEGKRQLLLTMHRGEAFKPCQGMTAGNVCCNYRVIDLVSGCPMDCSYCILQAYLANNPVTTVYVNLEAILAQVGAFLAEHPQRFFRIGTGELSDSLALDSVTEFASVLIPFFASKRNALLELKTKTAAVDHLLGLKELRQNKYSKLGCPARANRVVPIAVKVISMQVDLRPLFI